MYVDTYLGFMGILFLGLAGRCSTNIWTPAVLSVLHACVLYFCICTCSAQLSMFHMERHSRNMLIINISSSSSVVGGGVEEGGGEQTSLAHSISGSEPFSNVVVMVDCAGHLVVEAFYGSDQVVIDIIQPHGVPQSYIPHSLERLLEVQEDMVKAMLVLQVFVTEYSKIENLLSCAPSCSEACLFSFGLLDYYVLIRLLRSVNAGSF